MFPRSPAGSIAYSLWVQSRAILASSLAGTFLLCAIAIPLGPVPKVLMGAGAGLAFLTGLALLMGVVTYGGADLSAPESVYPRHAFTLPVPTRTLVGVPMMYGGLLIAGFWVVVGAALGWVGIGVPVVWPAGMMAAIVAWLQAASWSPYRYPFLRVGTVLLVLIVLVSIGAAGQVHQLHPVIAGLASGMIGALAYPVALAGVARARRGDGGARQRSRVESQKQYVPVDSAPRFTSAGAAQFWFDLVRIIWYPAAITALVEVILFLTFLGGRQARPSPLLPAWMPAGAVPLSVLLMVPLFVVMVHAVALGKFDMWSKPLDYPAFLLTRPVSTGQIVTGKLRAAGAMTVLVWLVAGAVTLAFMCVPRTYDAKRSWARVILENAGWRGAMTVTAGVLLLMILTWGHIARSLWITLSGKVWLVHGFPTVSMLAWGGAGWAGYWMHQNPTLWHAVTERAGLVLASVAIFRILVAIALFTYLIRRSLVDPAAGIRAFLAWILVCSVICSMLFVAIEPSRHAMFSVTAVVMLFVPLLRPAIAILSLHYNRHR